MSQRAYFFEGRSIEAVTEKRGPFVVITLVKIVWSMIIKNPVNESAFTMFAIAPLFRATMMTADDPFNRTISLVI